MANAEESDQHNSNASVAYISASSNRFARVADCAYPSSLVAFGSSKFVALWQPDDENNRGVYQTLPGHEGVVTCVRFTHEGRTLISADDHGSLRVWRGPGEWSSRLTYRAHEKAISSLAVLDDILATGSSDGSISILKLGLNEGTSKDSLERVQKIDLKGRYSLDIQLAYLPNSKTSTLAVASTDRNVGLWSRQGEKFIKVASLPGHEDWVKGLSFMSGVIRPEVLTLASGSQDGTIRLWNIEVKPKDKVAPQKSGEELSDGLLDSFEASLGDIAEGEEGGRQISMKQHVIAVKTDVDEFVQYTVTFDALLIGHDAGVTSVSWHPSGAGSAASPVLLSTSTDSSVILWSPSPLIATSNGESTSLWINHQRFGDVGGQRLGGFVGGLWGSNGADVLAWGWSGGWRRWKGNTDVNGSWNIDDAWSEADAITGHKGPVLGSSWSSGGEYLISTGPDQTTRIHAPCSSTSRTTENWHEISRPQVHGYDLIDAAFINPTQFVSIADEKVARVFEAPQAFTTLCSHLKILKDSDLEGQRPLAAAVPPLGLSNKAVKASEAPAFFTDSVENPSVRRRPFEGELSLSTLWPETEKVFGHGYELHALAVSHSGRFVATACKATTPEHAGIILYEIKSWGQFGDKLMGHVLTVTRVAFSRDDQFILSVSRDRTWRLYQFNNNGYHEIASNKAHARIIWDAAWSTNSAFFATASRDKTVKLWGIEGITKSQTPSAIIKTKEPATAVAIKLSEDERHILAVGLENGLISIYTGQGKVPTSWIEALNLDSSIAHVDMIHRLSWRPSQSSEDDHSRQENQLASCSEDGTLRIINITIQSH